MEKIARSSDVSFLPSGQRRGAAIAGAPGTKGRMAP